MRFDATFWGNQIEESVVICLKVTLNGVDSHGTKEKSISWYLGPNFDLTWTWVGPFESNLYSIFVKNYFLVFHRSYLLFSSTRYFWPHQKYSYPEIYCSDSENIGFFRFYGFFYVLGWRQKRRFLRVFWPKNRLKQNKINPCAKFDGTQPQNISPKFENDRSYGFLKVMQNR